MLLNFTDRAADWRGPPSGATWLRLAHLRSHNGWRGWCNLWLRFWFTWTKCGAAVVAAGTSLVSINHSLNNLPNIDSDTCPKVIILKVRDQQF